MREGVGAGSCCRAGCRGAGGPEPRCLPPPVPCQPLPSAAGAGQRFPVFPAPFPPPRGPDRRQRLILGGVATPVPSAPPPPSRRHQVAVLARPRGAAWHGARLCRPPAPWCPETAPAEGTRQDGEAGDGRMPPTQCQPRRHPLPGATRDGSERSRWQGRGRSQLGSPRRRGAWRAAVLSSSWRGTTQGGGPGGSGCGAGAAHACAVTRHARVRLCRAVHSRVLPCAALHTRAHPCSPMCYPKCLCTPVWSRVLPHTPVHTHVEPCPAPHTRAHPCGAVRSHARPRSLG